MLFLMNDLYVSLREEQNIVVNKEIEEFKRAMSRKKQSMDYYTSDRKANPERLSTNITLGKKAEYLALIGLKQKYGFPLVKIDTEIRVGNQKGWQKDLLFNQKDARFPNVHVKGCDNYTYKICGDYSWTFQYSNENGRFGRDEIFNSSSDSDLIALVFVENYYDKDGIIKIILPWSIAKNYLAPPVNKEFIKIKKCLYYKDLIDNKEKIEKLINEKL